MACSKTLKKLIAPSLRYNSRMFITKAMPVSQTF